MSKPCFYCTLLSPSTDASLTFGLLLGAPISMLSTTGHGSAYLHHLAQGFALCPAEFPFLQFWHLFSAVCCPFPQHILADVFGTGQVLLWALGSQGWTGLSFLELTFQSGLTLLVLSSRLWTSWPVTLLVFSSHPLRCNVISLLCSLHQNKDATLVVQVCS